LVDDAFARNIPVVAEDEDSPASQALKEITLKLLETKIKPAEKITPRLERVFWGLAESLRAQSSEIDRKVAEELWFPRDSRET